MNYKEIYDKYFELKNILEEKKEAIKSRNLDELARLDEQCMALSDVLKKIDIPNLAKTFSDKEKEDLRNLGYEIKKIEEHNEMLINHSLDVINNTLTGIINIVQSDKCSYDSKGKTLGDSESMNISSITEEA